MLIRMLVCFFMLRARARGRRDFWFVDIKRRSGKITLKCVQCDESELLTYTAFDRWFLA